MNFMKNIVLIFVFFCCCTISSFSQEVIQLWENNKMPNSKGLMLKDSIAQDRLYQVGSPRMYVYPAPAENNTGVAVLIVPGGGYLRLPASFRNNPTAKFFNSIGVNAFVLCHRLPTSPDLVTRQIAPLQDAQRAMRIIRANAEKMGININKIGVCGTSAGGHVSTTLATHEEDVSKVGDSFDQYAFNPDFMIIVSAVISMDDKITHKISKRCLLGDNPSEELVKEYSNETRVTAKTPPTFLVHADNDNTVPSLNSIAFYQATKAAGVSASLHIFPYGGHGISAAGNKGSTEMWTSICAEWLKEMKIIE